MYSLIYLITKKIYIILNYLLQKLWYAPVFKARCKEVGRALSLPMGIPFIAGHAQITIGDNVILYKLSIGTGAVIDEPTLSIGNNTIIKGKSTIGPNLKISIGRNCTIEDNFLALDTDGHPLNPQLRKERKPVHRSMLHETTIGDHVYIGRNVSILKGVNVGNCAVIMPNTLVIKDIPENSIACGVPAKIIALSK
ncbi:MAG TPA: acyltransferase [Spirochaetota bacterium]|nr:acyltransferase [Spirochaetota bacterium]HPR47784.1 acyltransferase [Spirochaetota bacterium]